MITELPSRPQLDRFFLLSGLWVAIHVSCFTTAKTYSTPAVALWTLATTISYSCLYLLPAMLPAYLLYCLFRRRPANRYARPVLATTLIVLTGSIQVLLFADRVIHDMYGFHINGFVIDLVFSPGGIDSLGASRSTEVTAVLIATTFFALQAASYLWAVRRAAGKPLNPPVFRLRWLLLAILCMAVGERVAYGFSAASNYQPILFASESYPLYLPTTFRKLASRLGVDAPVAAATRVRYGSLNYPLAPLDVAAPAKLPNIVWLVAESLRFDMLERRIMPELWTFSEQALRLEQHYSGGNMTQFGVFSMFYGLYGNYWFTMQKARRAPLLIDLLQQNHYQFSLHTSQRFTYPAFDQTIFVNIDPADLHERSAGAPAWERDRQNVDDMIRFIDQRDRKRPFMAYLFFEGTHANYSFPPDSVIAAPYVDDFNYLTTDFTTQIHEIKNRYLNAAHHVDRQIGRLIRHLRQAHLLDNTIVIVLGDHGEEFMESSGRWGHSAEFNRMQTSTPAVIWVPGETPRVVRGISSHLDIVPTLMPLLGVRNPPSDYSQGSNLLAADFHRDYAVAADWNRVAYIGERYKIAFPINAIGAVRSEVLDVEDKPVDDREQARTEIRQAMLEIMNNLTRFSRSQR